MSAEPIARFEAAEGGRVYRLPLRAFPGFIAHVYVVIDGAYTALIDTGTGFGDSHTDLLEGFAALRNEWHESIAIASLSRLIITHAHIDHYGGLSQLRPLTAAPIAIHELDRRVLVNYTERYTLIRRALARFIDYAGVDLAKRAAMLQIYGSAKADFPPYDVATVLHQGDLLDDRFQVYHAPGHCPGQICLQYGDILFSADHVLLGITPHMAPESITPFTGLDHYLLALESIRSLRGIRLTLGGHNAAIENLGQRIDEIFASHRRKLDRVLDACAEPRTIEEVTNLLYPRVTGYDVLLALEEVGAHVEYLDQRGTLRIANLQQVADDETVPPRFQRREP